MKPKVWNCPVCNVDFDDLAVVRCPECRNTNLTPVESVDVHFVNAPSPQYKAAFDTMRATLAAALQWVPRDRKIKTEIEAALAKADSAQRRGRKVVPS